MTAPPIETGLTRREPAPPASRSRRIGLQVLKDARIPLLCLVLIGLELWHLSSIEMDRIEAARLNFEGVLAATGEHVYITATIVVLVLAVAIPLGVMVTRHSTRFLAAPVLVFANVGQAAPTVGLLAIVGIFYIGFTPVVLMIAAYSVLPVLRNTIVGLQQVDSGVIDAARGQGMSATGILFRVELPLAVPIIATGARTALVLAVAVVPFGDFLGAGGLGNMVIAGLKLNRNEVIFCGALLIAILALLVDWLGGLLQRWLTPAGIR